MGFVEVWSDTGLECQESLGSTPAAPPSTPPDQALRQTATLASGRTPNAQAMLTGRGYREGSLRVPGSATLEIAETRCNDGRVDRRCAGVFRATLEVEQIVLADDAETGASTLNWAHEAPQPPTPTPPQVCLSAADPVALVGGGAMSLFFTQGFDGHSGQFQQAPFPRDMQLTRTVTTHAETNDVVSPPFEMRDFRAISRTTATFQRVG